MQEYFVYFNFSKLKEMGPVLAQHFGEVVLKVHVQQKDFFALQRKIDSQVIDRSAFSHAESPRSRQSALDARHWRSAPLLIGYAYHLCFSHWLSSFT